LPARVIRRPAAGELLPDRAANLRQETALPRPIATLLASCLAALAALGMLLAMPAAADAHPLGNFTINHYTRIDAAQKGIELFRVLDMAEIPTVQERQRIDLNDDGTVDDAEAAAWAAGKAEELAAGMGLSVNGDDVSLTPISHELTFQEGQGGLSTLRLTVTYRADLAAGWRDASPRVEFADENYGDRLGWREVIVRGGPGVELVESTAPSTDASRELTAYPEDQLSSPLDVRSATFSVRPGAGAPLADTHPRQDTAVRGNPDGTLERYAGLIAKDDLTPGVIAIALLAAVAFGAYHALTPGHGKTIVAAYLVGSRGTAWHALLLGLVVTATHTSTVYLVGFVALYLSQYIVPEDLYPWLGIASGGLIVAMGLTLLVSRLRASGLLRDAARWLRGPLSSRRPQLAMAGEAGALVVALPGASTPSSHDHATHGDHTHASHDHRHDHGETASHRHGFAPAHSHRIPGQDGEPVTLRSLVGLGVFGGMIPCPSAIVVMLSAIALHRVAFGLVLIVAFSVGLAGVLVAIGFALVYARSMSQRIPLLAAVSGRIEGGTLTSRLARAVPVAAAGAVVAAGTIILLRALAQQGAL
jgi:ABC-type nickel/cobalt efflux system permease component RcnA